ncbi:uncharacterized protein LOC133744473 [Rosa rugosa]|uniref:uncharacterized protein LOC133744473 n=1 Tax=Rosa rugosa TaxID=74645 RepID=UPI002B404AE0|nr:uncharacterized protein LOC133744473 [Rosa rugosa]
MWGKISWDYVRACENLDKIGYYDWAKEVGSFLKKSIKALKKKNSKSSYGNTGGCVLIILYWFCQKTEKIKPISGREKEEHEMRKWDIQRLIQNWTSFNSLKKLTEDQEESESDEEENRSDEAKTAPEGQEEGNDDQNSENEEDNLEVEKKLKEKKQELKKFAEDMENLEERNAELMTENLCLTSSVKELELNSTGPHHRSPPSKAAENTEKEDQSTVEEGQSQEIFTVEEFVAAAAQSPPHFTVQEETQSTPPSHKDSLFQSPTVRKLTVEEMERQPDMFQIVKTPIAAHASPLHTLSIEEEQKTPEENKKSELTMRITEKHSGQTEKNTEEGQHLLVGDVKAKREKKAKEKEDRLRAAEKEEKEKQKKASLQPEERKKLEEMVAQQNLDGLPEDVLKAIREIDAKEKAEINEESEEKQLPPEVIDWEKSKVYNYMDQDTKRRVQRYWQNAPSG